MVCKVVTFPNKVLMSPSEKVDTGSEKSISELKALVRDMQDTMASLENVPAAGLSAVQIGKPLRVLIARDFAYDSSGEKILTVKEYILINPKYISLSKDKEVDWEGCLSFPNEYGKVQRHKRIKVKYIDESGSEQRLTASGFLARVIQHEMDHLEGITFNTKIIGRMVSGEDLDNKVKVAD